MSPLPALQNAARAALTRCTPKSARFGIATHLGVAFVAVVALVLAANFLVVRAVSVETTTTVYQRVVEHAPPPSGVVQNESAPTVRRVETTDLQTAFRRYGEAVRGRIDSQSDSASVELQAAANDLQHAISTFSTQAADIGKRFEAARIVSALTSWQSDADAVIRLADERRRTLRDYVTNVDALNLHAKRSLENSWKIFGLVITRQTLLQYNAALAELRSATGNLKEDNAGERDTIQQLVMLEAKASRLLESNESGYRRTLGAEWYASQHAGYEQLAQLRQAFERQSQTLNARAAANSQVGDEALMAIPRHLQTLTPAPQSSPVIALRAEGAPALGSGSAPLPQVDDVSSPTTTQSVVYHDADNRQRQLVIACISAGVVLILLVIGAGTIISIARPVRRLLDATTRLARGEGSVRVERGGIRELDRLAVAFNSMADELAQARAVAIDYQRGLEDKVDERTRQLRDYAENDYLTGLPNRRQFLALLHGTLEDAEVRGHMVGVYFLDVDNFKYINDSLGHAFGDRVLISLANRLRETVDGFGNAARFGGDEFTVLFEGARTLDEIREAGLKIVRAFQDPLSIDGRDLIVGVSVGASIYPEHEKEAESLLKAADAALFRAKRLGRSQMAVFTSDLLEAAASSFTTEQGLRRAIERGEFELLFQPEVDAESLQTQLVEALIRWRMPDGRLIAPGEFLAVAEESGLILEICDWVLIRAVQSAARLHHGSWPDVRIAINIFPRQLLDPGFIGRLQNLLTQFRVPARCIEIELTESVLQTGPTTLAALRQLQAMGIAIALDDFGTGYSSLSSLQQLPLSRVKLDRSLIADMDASPRSRSMVRAIIGMCQELGLQITAEGVERPEQFLHLSEHRHLYLQGFLLSHPVPELELERVRGQVALRAQELLLTAQTQPVVKSPHERDLSAAQSA